MTAKSFLMYLLLCSAAQRASWMIYRFMSFSRRLEMRRLKRHMKSQWCLIEITAELIARMERVLDINSQAPEFRGRSEVTILIHAKKCLRSQYESQHYFSHQSRLCRQPVPPQLLGILPLNTVDDRTLKCQRICIRRIE